MGPCHHADYNILSWSDGLTCLFEQSLISCTSRVQLHYSFWWITVKKHISSDNKVKYYIMKDNACFLVELISLMSEGANWLIQTN